MKKASITICFVLLCQLGFTQRTNERKLVDKAKDKISRQDDIKQSTNQEKQRPSRDESTKSWNDVEELFTKPFIFTRGELQVGGDDADKKEAFAEAIRKSNAVIDEYKMAIDQFLQGKPAASIYSNKLKSSEAKAKGLASTVKLADTEFKSGNSLGGVYYLQKVYLFQGYLEAQTKVFPESQILKDHLQMANEAIQKYGSTDKYLGKMEANKKEYAKNLKLIPAGQKNSKIEALVKKEYEAFAKNFTVTRVNITDGAWRIEKNDLGIPLNRKVSVSIAVKNSKGECGIAGANIIEEYSGGGNYGSSVMYLPTDVIIVPCENIK
jgi:hypothetical protein